METPPFIGPALFMACCDNNVIEVKRLLALGANVLERVPPGPFSFAGGLAIGPTHMKRSARACAIEAT